MKGKRDERLMKVGKIKSPFERTHGYCAEEELQFRPKLASSTEYSFNIRFQSGWMDGGLGGWICGKKNGSKG